jgi:hypothetical protein
VTGEPDLDGPRGTVGERGNHTKKAGKTKSAARKNAATTTIRERTRLRFIAALRAAGFDHELRAGQALWSFILSRSRRHGLRQNQPYVVFDLHDQEMVMQVWGDAKRVRLPRAELTSEVSAALRRLAAQAID